MPILKKPQGNAQPGKPTPQQQKSAPKKDAFAERYEQADAKGGFVPPDPGTYNALITECQATRDDEGVKESVYLECTITDDTCPGKAIRIYYNLSNEKGEEMPGISFLKSNLEMLRVDQPTSWDDLQEKLAELAQSQPWVVIDVKQKGKYTNCYLSSVPEDQDNKPSL